MNRYLTSFDLHYINTYNNFYVIQLFVLNNINFSWHHLCKSFFIIFILLCIIIVIALHNIYQYTKAQSKICKEPRGIPLPIHYRYTVILTVLFFITILYHCMQHLKHTVETEQGFTVKLYVTLSLFKLYCTVYTSIP